MFIRPLPLFVAFAMLLGSGLAHGIWTQRWQPSQVFEDACARVNTVPTKAGAWESSKLEVEGEAFRQAGAVGYWARRYDKEGTGSPITVILMCGRAGQMSVHTPDICYRGAGYEMTGEQTKETFSFSGAGSGAEFWSAHFRLPSSASDSDLRIFWAWNAGNGWQAPAAPRWVFGGNPFLYKLYVARDGAGSAATTEEFMQRLLPVLEKSLFSMESQRR